MNGGSLIFDAVAEPQASAKWRARWERSWPDYRAWFLARGGESGPSRAEAEAALARYMPELVPVHRRLTRIAGGGDLAARFLATWCPPRYLGGCSVAAVTGEGGTRLLRNYDLAPELNEGLLLRSEWTGRPVMGMVEFLWGLSDGVNGAGLAAALAYGGHPETAEGFGVTTLMRYVLETCGSVPEAIAALRRIPSHMAYNVTLADRTGRTATLELWPGGGLALCRPAIATNHQRSRDAGARPDPGQSRDRRAHLERLLRGAPPPDRLAEAFLEPPLYRRDHAGGFGTLFTAVYDPAAGALSLLWPDRRWHQALDAFEEGRRVIRYAAGPGAATTPAGGAELAAALQALRPWLSRPGAAALDRWCEEARGGHCDWAAFGRAFSC
ncbi:C45 family peptidase [Amaricoccus sp.]|uniref:C45 family peptidase n=1 Tax=Amaricoccus sp. TaxID=1872485 RepID=UPI002B8A6A6E|nr:C45 family peptidase [Amaricoccus sp.]HRW15016.1 C45 family autoproteolytic acyltransferase/hydrolase [Amaricoccus sp.]